MIPWFFISWYHHFIDDIRPGFVNYKKECTLLAAASDTDLLAHGRWFSPGTPASSTTKTGRHDIAEILLKVALKYPPPPKKKKKNHFIENLISTNLRTHDYVFCEQTTNIGILS
jgi:hypothetical protein